MSKLKSHFVALSNLFALSITAIFLLTNLTLMAGAIGTDRVVPIVATTSKISVFVNGDPVQFDAQPIIINNRVMVPMRAVLEKMGVTVFWDQETSASVATTKQDAMYIYYGSDFECSREGELQFGYNMIVNEELQFLDVPPQLINNRMLVPLRAVAQAFGAQVGWNGATQTVTISSNIPTALRLSESEKASLNSFTFDDALVILDRIGYIGAGTEGYFTYMNGKKYWNFAVLPLGTTEEEMYYTENAIWVSVSCDGTVSEISWVSE